MIKKLHILVKSGFVLFVFTNTAFNEPLLESVHRLRYSFVTSALKSPSLQHLDLKRMMCYYDSSIEIQNNHTTNSTKQETQILKTNVTKKNQKIYIYNTHQEEEYRDEGGVYEGALYLKKLLEKKGYEVLVEERLINDYLNQHQLTYNESYEASYTYLTDTLKDQSFDLIIDFHRDSIDRSMCVFEDNQKKYAKLMFVIGGSNDNYATLKANTDALHQKIDGILPGIMRAAMTRDIAYYNQYVSDEMVLLEVGSDANDYAEVQNSLEIVAEGIDAFLKEKKQ